jgi:acyl-CoA reductase-like NAD-dependent aldehyde dehydrogenase
MNFKQRQQALVQTAINLANEEFQQKLISAYSQDTGFLKKNVKIREVTTPIAILNEIGKETNLTKAYGVNLQQLQSLGKVAVLLPRNGVNLCLAKSVGASFLVGNETIIKLPRKLNQSGKYYRELVLNNLPNVSFAPDGMSSEAFLKKCIADREIKAVVIYGDDHWIWGYKNLVRRSNTKLIFEGPGKDPLIVMEDADIDMAVKDSVKGGLLNGGQSCSAIERFFVHESLMDEFCTKLTQELIKLKVGSSESEDTDIGPILSTSVLERLDEQVKDAQAAGAKVLIGGNMQRIGSTDNYAFLPTIITGCTSDMRIIKEENFGPVFPIISFSSELDLLPKVDNCDYGLNASIYGTLSVEFREYLINSHRSVYFNCSVFNSGNIGAQVIDGGYKNSGFIWKWHEDRFLQIEGKRMLLKELSLQTPLAEIQNVATIDVETMIAQV